VRGVKKSERAPLKAQRIARCYRTVSDMAALVLAKISAAYLLAVSRKTMAESKKSGNANLWDSTEKAAWTRRLIPDVVR